MAGVEGVVPTMGVDLAGVEDMVKVATGRVARVATSSVTRVATSSMARVATNHVVRVATNHVTRVATIVTRVTAEDRPTTVTTRVTEVTEGEIIKVEEMIF